MLRVLAITLLILHATAIEVSVAELIQVFELGEEAGTSNSSEVALGEFPVGDDCEVVRVGNNGGRNSQKSVTMNNPDYICPSYVDKQNWYEGGYPWPDVYCVQQDGNTLTAFRQDIKGIGWGMDLKIKCCSPAVPVRPEAEMQCLPQSWRYCSSWGDPHIITFDSSLGTATNGFDWMTPGPELLFSYGDYEVYQKSRTIATSSSVAVNEGMWINVKGDTVFESDAVCNGNVLDGSKVEMQDIHGKSGMYWWVKMTKSEMHYRITFKGYDKLEVFTRCDGDGWHGKYINIGIKFKEDTHAAKGLCTGRPSNTGQFDFETCAKAEQCCSAEFMPKRPALHEGCLVDAYEACCEVPNAGDACCGFMNDDGQCHDHRDCDEGDWCENEKCVEKPFKNCDEHTCASEPLKADAADIECPDKQCTDELCCAPLMCSEYDCQTLPYLKGDAAEIECTGACTDELCCYRPKKFCSTHLCFPPKVMIGDAASVECPDAECSSELCCMDKPVVMCSSYVCQNSPALLQTADEIECPDGNCSDELCCEAHDECGAREYLEEGYPCDYLLAAGLDMTGCGCEDDECVPVCKDMVEQQGFTCAEAKLAGYECSPCDPCGGCQCQKYIDRGYSCEQIEAAGLDCSGCDCPVCTIQAYIDQYGCSAMIGAGWDVSGCSCEDKCLQVCYEYVQQGYTCQECEMAGLKCTPCDPCGGCACAKYIDEGYTCEQIEEAGLDCDGCECPSCVASSYFAAGYDCVTLKQADVDVTGCDCDDVCAWDHYLQWYTCDDMIELGHDVSGCDCDACVAPEYFEAGYDCVTLKQAGVDVTGCGCDNVCACQEYLDQGQLTCGTLEAAGMNCSGCDCSGCTCQEYLDQSYSCDFLNGSGMDCSGCDCSPKCTTTCENYLVQGMTKDSLLASGIDCTACPDVCTTGCQSNLDQGFSCATLADYGMDCSACDC